MRYLEWGSGMPQFWSWHAITPATFRGGRLQRVPLDRTTTIYDKAGESIILALIINPRSYWVSSTQKSKTVTIVVVGVGEKCQELSVRSLTG